MEGFRESVLRIRSCCLSGNTSEGCGFVISVSIFNYNQRALCEQFYYVATSFNPELGSSLDHDTGM